MIEAISDLRFPKNFSYVFGGLKPLSIKYIESIFEMKGFKNIDKKSLENQKHIIKFSKRNKIPFFFKISIRTLPEA